jgi:hypothetical protein
LAASATGLILAEPAVDLTAVGLGLYLGVIGLLQLIAAKLGDTHRVRRRSPRAARSALEPVPFRP